MFKGNQILLLYIMTVILFQPVIASSSNSLSVREVLSVNTGDESSNIKNQFVGATTEPYDGFAVDSKGNILISDTVNHRIMRFSKEAKLSDLLIGKDRSLFWPLNLCLTEDDVLYVQSLEKKEEVIIVFSPDGKVLKSFKPASISEFKNKEHHIMSLTCSKMTVTALIGIGNKINDPTYLDEYDQNLNLINRKVFYGYRGGIYEEIDKSIQRFEKHFEDSHGNKYGYPLERDWYGKFLPLQKYSPEGKLLSTIDGPLLTKHTKYKVYDYYTGRNKLVLDLQYMKKNDYMIATWYVTPSGVIYALIANTEYVKVLKIEENGKTTN
jgi:hypothetical protein